jgi:hypothetical protein
LDSDEVIIVTKKLSQLLLGSPVIELATDSDSIDTYSLCGSKHEAWIYVTDEDGSGIPNAKEDSIIIAFSGTDSSGAGCLDEVFETVLDVANGSITYITDPEEWQSTVDDGLDIIMQRYNDDPTFYNLVTAGTYAGIYGVTSAVSWAGQGISSGVSTVVDFVSDPCYITTAVMRSEGHDNSPELNSMRRLRDSWVIWQAPNEVKEYYRDAPSIVKEIDSRADSDKIYHRLYNQYILPAHRQVSRGNMGSAHRIYRSMVSDTRKYASEERTYRSEVTTCKFWDSSKPDGSFLGTVYHNQNGGEHKVKITINKLYQGKTTTVYQTELAGGEVYKKEGNVLLFEPAYRKFKLNGPGTYTVKVESLAANMDCGNPSLDLQTTVEVAEGPADSEETDTGGITALNEGVTNITEATGVRPIYLYGGIVLLGGVLVSRYMNLFSGPSEEEVSEDEE